MERCELTLGGYVTIIIQYRLWPCQLSP